MSKNADSTVLVTGGCGFLGSHIVDALVADHFAVVAISRNPTRYCNPDARYVALNLHNAEAVAALIDHVQPYAIVHTVTAGPNAPRAAHDKEYKATKNLLEIAHQAPSVKAFIYTSSAEAVANLNGSHKLSETDAVLHTDASAPTNYARVKAASERLIRSFNRSVACSERGYAGSLRTVILRMPGIYGPRDGSIAPGLLQGTNTLVSRLQFGDNKSLNEWIYVESAASAHLLATKALLNDDVSGIEGEVFFFSDGEPLRFWDFARKLWAAAGDKNVSRPEKRIVSPWAPIVALATLVELLTFIFTFGRMIPPMSRHHLQYMRFGAWWDIGKARERLQYEPLVSTDEGIRRTVAWFQQKSK
jgi:sterol-4alpha-carboxylate 3-dehydrogenase (decarboxylating)